jgi:hypothetical protein
MPHIDQLVNKRLGDRGSGATNNAAGCSETAIQRLDFSKSW